MLSTLLGLPEWPGNFFCTMQLPSASLSTHFLKSSMWLLLPPLQCPKKEMCLKKILCCISWHQEEKIHPKVRILLRSFMSFVHLSHQTDFRIFFVPSCILWSCEWNIEFLIAGIYVESISIHPPTSSLYNFLSFGAKLLDLNQLRCYLALNKGLMRLSGPWFAYHKIGPVYMTGRRLYWMHVNLWCGTWCCCFRNVLG